MKEITNTSKAVNYNLTIETLEPKDSKIGKIYVTNTRDYMPQMKGKVLSKGGSTPQEIEVGQTVLFDCRNALELKSVEEEGGLRKLLLVNSGDVLLII